MIGSEKARARVMRKIVAAIVASDITLEEMNILRDLISDDAGCFDKIIRASQASVENISDSTLFARSSKDRSRRDLEIAIREVSNKLSSGEITREDLIKEIQSVGVLPISVSTMKKMHIKTLLERALTEMGPVGRLKFLRNLQGGPIEDPYLIGIEKKRRF